MPEAPLENAATDATLPAAAEGTAAAPDGTADAFTFALVDYHKGNIKSVERGLQRAGAEHVVVTDDPAVVAAADAIVLPGVGAFADASETLRELGLMDAIREKTVAGTPFLGICLGMHLMYAEGTENAGAENAPGLGLLPGVVDNIPNTDEAGVVYKIPHVGWNSIEPVSDCAGAAPSARSSAASAASEACLSTEGAAPAQGDAGTEGAGEDGLFAKGFTTPLLEGIAPGEYFYFTHSFVAPDGPGTVAVTRHSVAFPSIAQYGACAWGVQFHPEKSSAAGDRLLQNFVRIAYGLA